MHEPHPSPGADLPAYRAVVVVDVENFTGIASAHQQRVHDAIPVVLERAFDRSGLAAQWSGRRFSAGTGDGYIAGIATAKLPTLIDTFIGRLQEVLAETDRELRAVDRTLRMRMRLSIHVGALPEEGIGQPMNDTHRLLDSAPVRARLKTTGPDTTFLAAIISDRAFQDAVKGGYTALRPEVFQEVVATVAHKGFAERAWLYVPVPSYRDGGAAEEPAQQDGPGPHTPHAGPAPSVHNEFSGGTSRGMFIQTGGIGHIHGVSEGEADQ